MQNQCPHCETRYDISQEKAAIPSVPAEQEKSPVSPPPLLDSIFRKVNNNVKKLKKHPVWEKAMLKFPLFKKLPINIAGILSISFVVLLTLFVLWTLIGKTEKVKRIKLDESFSFKAPVELGPMSMRIKEPKLNNFSMVFKQIRTEERDPTGCTPEVLEGWLEQYRLGPIKYLVVIASIQNIGPEKGLPDIRGEIQIKTDSGEIFYAGAMWYQPKTEKYIAKNRWESTREYRVEPLFSRWATADVGEKKEIMFWGKIPEDTTPVELTGFLGGTDLEKKGVTKFHVRLAKSDLGT